MSSGMTIRSGLTMVLAMAAITGCGVEGSRGVDPALPAVYRPDEAGVLRVRADVARGRLWVLGVDGVRVYDAATKSLVRVIPLPRWDVARFICDPDMVLHPSGAVIVSSNVRAKLWWIDADSFEVGERDITLDGREQWDIGFGALALAADGKLLALTSTGGWLWQIDVEAGRAHLWNWGAPMLNVCELTPIE